MTATKRRGKTVEDFLSYRLSVVSGIMRRTGGLRAKREYDLNVWESWALAWLGSRPGLGLLELARHTHLDKGQTSRVISELVDRGLVQRDDRNPGRGILLSLTPSGEKLYERVLDAARRYDQAALSTLTKEEQATIGPILDKLEAAAMDLLAKELEGQPPG